MRGVAFTLTLGLTVEDMSNPTSNSSSPIDGDRLAETAALIEILDAVDELPEAAQLRRATYAELSLTTGTRVIDVGCGTGLAVAEMSELGAEAVGVDSDPVMIAAAQERRPRLDLRLGDATDVPFADGAFTAYRADKVFHQVTDPRHVLLEARRLLAPAGRIALVGQDWDAFIIDSDDPPLTRRIVAARSDALPSPRAARQYRDLLLETGFDEVKVKGFLSVFTSSLALPVTLGLADTAEESGAITREAATRWRDEQRERAANGRFLLAVPLLMASARRPWDD